ncbi:flagellar hook-associated protein FlgL [Georgenia sp. H159]|uniref:flagellar hook-associated protein FlgL n=1 Tax=Georgenia sp. H159 TaxID=3076115 RepID=UPI002D7879C9|nr:flagellar hook-associated protein FlgL [Georgenia sp. H159]
MIGRVTQLGLQRASLTHLQGNLAEMADLQHRLTTGKVITKPSDDPAGTVDAMQVRSDQRATAQYTRNAADGDAWLTTVDSALGQTLGDLHRARDLTVRGANAGALGPSSRSAIATELRATADSLLQTANTTYLGRSVFAGTSTQAAFVRGPEGTVTFTGRPGAEVLRRVSDTTEVRVDAAGSEVFGQDVLNADGTLVRDPATGVPAGMSVFTLLGEIANRIEAGDGDIGDSLAALDQRLSAVLAEVGSVGSRHGQVLQAQDALASREVALANRLSAVEDADLAETIVDLQLQEVSYQAALGATSRVLQPSLLDFLR